MVDEAVSPDDKGLGYTGCEVHCAQRHSHGGVRKIGKVISIDKAVAFRQSRVDIVVCGDSGRQNMQIAQSIESKATDRQFKFHAAHLDRGLLALPHFQRAKDENAGHTFYESPPDFVITNRGTST